MTTTIDRSKEIWTVSEVAHVVGVAPRTVSKWFDSGRLRGYRIPGTQDRRIPRKHLVAFLADHGMPSLDAVNVAGLFEMERQPLPEGKVDPRPLDPPSNVRNPGLHWIAQFCQWLHEGHGWEWPSLKEVLDDPTLYVEEWHAWLDCERGYDR